MIDWGMLFDFSRGDLAVYMTGLVACYFGGLKFGVVVWKIKQLGQVS